MLDVQAQDLVRVLHLEDNENDHLLVKEMLCSDGLACELAAVQTRAEFESALQRGRYDLILSDYTLPSFDGLSALALARELAPKTPFIFFSGTIGEESAVESLKGGAADYILKQRPYRLVPAIRNALHNAQERVRLEAAEQKNREQAALLDKARDAILVCDLNNRIVYWNQGAERIYGWTVAEALGQNLTQLLFHGKPPPQLHEAVNQVNQYGEWTGEFYEFTKDGKPVIVQSRATLIQDEQRQPKSLLLINTDITERKQLEEHFLRAQRLDSLGVLVSGIAHDLNNALAPILMGIDMLRKSAELKENILKTMEKSAWHGAEMVKQIVAFARGGDLHRAEVHVDQLIREMSRIVAETFPKNIRCCVEADSTTWRVSAISTQIYQVLMNLCVNARDAMPNGGTLTLAAANVHLDAAQAAQYPDAKPGDYLCIRAADTGTGMSGEQLKKIFQPFYSTKGLGKGTGLGLSTSLGIIKNHGGFMSVQSKVGIGTEFKFYLPALVEAPAKAPPATSALPAGNGECVLIVDDEATVLAIARTALETYGYGVLTACSGMEAAARLTEKGNSVDLAVIGLTLPFMGGEATAIALRKIKPDLKVVFADGSENAAKEASSRIKTEAFLSKPFTVEKLATTVHQVLANKENPVS